MSVLLLLYYKRAACWGYSSELKRLSVMLNEANTHRFREIANNKKHCIFTSYSIRKILPMKLRHFYCIFCGRNQLD